MSHDHESIKRKSYYFSRNHTISHQFSSFHDSIFFPQNAIYRIYNYNIDYDKIL